MTYWRPSRRFTSVDAARVPVRRWPSAFARGRGCVQGFYEGLGISDPLAVIRAVDKLDEVGPEGVAKFLSGGVDLPARTVDSCLALARTRGTGPAVVDDVKGPGVTSDLLTEGLGELSYVLDSLDDLPAGSVVADLSTARGLDY